MAGTDAQMRASGWASTFPKFQPVAQSANMVESVRCDFSPPPRNAQNVWEWRARMPSDDYPSDARDQSACVRPRGTALTLGTQPERLSAGGCASFAARRQKVGAIGRRCHGGPLIPMSESIWTI